MSLGNLLTRPYLINKKEEAIRISTDESFGNQHLIGFHQNMTSINFPLYF